MSDYQFNPNEEQWKEISGFPGYEVSDHGRVRSYWKLHGSKYLPSLENNPQRFLGFKDCDGYIRVIFKKEGRKFTKKVARLVLEAFFGPCPTGYETRHLDGIRDKNCFDNLKWGTKKEQGEDSVRHGRHKLTSHCGEKQWKSKLTVFQVKGIRRLHSEGFSQTAISKLFPVSRTQIGYIVNRKSWSHVT